MADVASFQQPQAPGQQQFAVSDKSFVATWLLSLLLGCFGADRFYLGKTGTAVLKLLTFGGLGLWALTDLVLTLCGVQYDKLGRPLEGYKQYRFMAWIVTLVPTGLAVLGGFALVTASLLVSGSGPIEAMTSGGFANTSGAAVDAEKEQALDQAQYYSDEYAMSEYGIFATLVDPEEDGFSEEAAYYALDNVAADWNENALIVAEYLRDEEHLPKEKIRDELLSIDSEAFTVEQVKYAMEHLDLAE
ncbi:hypothetical protein AUR04nite_21380 [Glutamicibacter uratoxydans]|uniref:TM2 domain-containing protein n=1 Tax=Glutamicibacter uratoxydans TaxID=43667 RepID=A0A4Y4DNV4_GLUUR|nr:Ltp family lipoprotein [Glutamicibacter uratoxydans]GED06606.1 hypothetical protein AUR04nite_21380 [Glutamicibacter uratoxydans]